MYGGVRANLCAFGLFHGVPYTSHYDPYQVEKNSKVFLYLVRFGLSQFT